MAGAFYIWAGSALAALVAGYGGLAGFGAWRWSRHRQSLITRLYAAAQTRGVTQEGAATCYHAAATADLPDPVRRYLAHVLTEGQPVIRSASVTMRGRFNLSLDAPKWRGFTSTQAVSTLRPGFVWDGAIRLFPGVTIRVTDAYIAGIGSLHPALYGLIAVGDQQGGGAIAEAELMRWLAETAWYPTALLPGQGVTWQAEDAHAARATLKDGGLADGAICVSLLFRFGTDGLIASVHADGRAGSVDGVVVRMPWECRLSDYQRQNGILVPMAGAALYHTAQGERCYFRGKVTALHHGFLA